MSMRIKTYDCSKTKLGPPETGVKISTDNSTYPSIVTFKTNASGGLGVIAHHHHQARSAISPNKGV